MPFADNQGAKLFYDVAGKGPALLGVRAVIAASYERIHRSNLVGMGVLPLQFPEGESAASLGLDGRETFAIEGLAALVNINPAPVFVFFADHGAPAPAFLLDGSETITPADGSRYYLVVPLSETSEGSYGDGSSGARPRSTDPCRPLSDPSPCG